VAQASSVWSFKFMWVKTTSLELSESGSTAKP